VSEVDQNTEYWTKEHFQFPAFRAGSQSSGPEFVADGPRWADLRQDGLKSSLNGQGFWLAVSWFESFHKLHTDQLQAICGLTLTHEFTSFQYLYIYFANGTDSAMFTEIYSP
jgi:hypothetical protein